MTNKDAMKCFLSIGLRAYEMALFIAESGNNIDGLHLTKLMGELHNNQQKVEDWLFELITTKKEPVND